MVTEEPSRHVRVTTSVLDEEDPDEVAAVVQALSAAAGAEGILRGV